MMNGKPRVAVVGNNTLALIGLRHLLQSVMPMIEVDTLGSFAELTANNPDQYFHYFVSIEIMLSERAFFLERRRKTIVLTTAQTERVRKSSSQASTQRKSGVKWSIVKEKHALQREFSCRLEISQKQSFLQKYLRQLM